MALPRNQSPVYEMMLPLLGKKVKYRGFCVKEQKALLMAVQGNTSEIILAVNEAVYACLFEAVDVDTLANYDLEYAFMQIRMRSAGETIDLELTCHKCDTKNDYTLNLGDVKPDVKKSNNKIQLSDNLGVIMRYPTTAEMGYLDDKPTTETVFNTIMNCIETVYTQDEIFETKNESEKERREFIESLSPEQLSLIEQFFASIPVLKHEFKNTCGSCSYESTYVMEGIESFFG